VCNASALDEFSQQSGQKESEVNLLPYWPRKLSPNFPFAITDNERKHVRLRKITVVSATPRGGSLREGLTSSRGVDNGILGWVPGGGFWEWNRYHKIVEENLMNFPDRCSGSGDGSRLLWRG
jgi:hypothetical protein